MLKPVASLESAVDNRQNISNHVTSRRSSSSSRSSARRARRSALRPLNRPVGANDPFVSLFGGIGNVRLRIVVHEKPPRWVAQVIGEPGFARLRTNQSPGGLDTVQFKCSFKKDGLERCPPPPPGGPSMKTRNEQGSLGIQIVRASVSDLTSSHGKDLLRPSALSQRAWSRSARCQIGCIRSRISK